SVQSALDVATLYSFEAILSIILGSPMNQLGNPDRDSQNQGLELAHAVRGMFDTSEELLFSFPFWKYFHTTKLKQLFKHWDNIFRVNEDLRLKHGSDVENRDAFANSIYA